MNEEKENPLTVSAGRIQEIRLAYESGLIGKTHALTMLGFDVKKNHGKPKAKKEPKPTNAEKALAVLQALEDEKKAVMKEGQYFGIYVKDWRDAVIKSGMTRQSYYSSSDRLVEEGKVKINEGTHAFIVQ